MKHSGRTAYQLIRIVPFDLGFSVTPDDSRIFRDRCTQLKEWSKSDDPYPKTASSELNFASAFSNDGLSIHLYIFSEGVAVFYLEEELHYLDSIDDFDPELINLNKGIGNYNILKRLHQHSIFLDKVIFQIRNIKTTKGKRLSARDTFESGGLSYVFSYILINCQRHELTASNKKKSALCLFPKYGKSSSNEDIYSRMHEYTSSLDRRLEERMTGEEMTILEERDDLISMSSWSSLSVMGNIDSSVDEYYKWKQVELQRIWFYTYAVGKMIDDVTSNMYQMSLPTLLQIEQMITEMIFKIRKLDAIFWSVSNTRDFRVYDGLRESSRLDRLIKSIELSAKYLIDLSRLRIEQNRINASKTIEYVLFILAAIQAFSGYYEISTAYRNGNISGLELSMLGCALIGIALLFLRYIRGR